MAAGYLNGHLNGEFIKRAVTNMAMLIKKHKIKFDYIVYTGISGSLVAIPLAFFLNKKLICIRKRVNESSHSCNLIEHDGPDDGRYIFIDDFISEGKTTKKIFNLMSKNTNLVCAGILLYHSEQIELKHYNLLKKYKTIPIYCFNTE